jgi:transcriptional regulator with XRE-family HTH domain
VNTQSSLAEQLKNKEYRDAFVASQLRIGLPMQCRALRESRELTQPQLAEAAGMSQPRISEIERPGERKPNLDTLLRLASAFDVALQVRFVPFSKLIDDDDAIHFDSFYVEPFDEDMSRLEKQESQMKSVAILTPSNSSAILRDLTRQNQPDDMSVLKDARTSSGVSLVNKKLQSSQTENSQTERGNLANLSSIAS